MWRRWVLLVTAAALLSAACGGSGPNAPDIGGLETVCGGEFCIEYPHGWDIVEATDDFVSLAHPDAPEAAVATVGRVNMEGVVNADGKQWPQTTETVVRSFWALIDGGGADLATMSPQRDGSIESFGTFQGGRLWWRLTPLQDERAIGIEVRGPNSTWAPHAETIMRSLIVVDP